MRQFFQIFFASLLALVVAGILFFIGFFAMIAGISRSVSSDKTEIAGANSVLVLDVDDILHEQGMRNSFSALSGDHVYNPGLYDVTKAIEHAGEDGNIKGILIRLGGTSNGWATLQQLRSALLGFKARHKFVYAYGELITQKSYYLASVADSVYLNPSGFFELKGLSSEIPFFKGTLEKLEVQPEIFYAGKFKSATEPFRADRISEPNRAQIMALQNDVWNEFLTAAAKHARVDRSEVYKMVMGGEVQFASDAKEHGLVDGLLYWDEVEQRVRAKTGQKADEKISYAEMSDYAYNVKTDRKIKDSRIAVVFAEGDITDGEGNDEVEIASGALIKEIRKVKNNDKIKAVVLRINSPGGSALASEVILRELQLLKQKKPLIVSMGDVAASGGYYIACQADSIFALPNTITGSIGVFTMLFNSEQLLRNKLGISFDEVKNAPYADFPTVTRPLTADEAARMQRSVDTIYSVFKRRVSIGRRMDEVMVDSFAQGRVWSGTAALKIGLVDGLGNLDRAIVSAARKAGLKDYQVTTYPEPVDKFKSLMNRLKGNTAAAVTVESVVRNELGIDYDFYKQVKQLRKMNGRAMMVMPFRMGFD